MKITVEYEAAFRNLQGNPDFNKFLEWIGKECEISNETLIFNTTEDIKVLRGRTQALVTIIKTIDEYYKRVRG